jgi:uncharacterized lipoprotein YbaY
MEELDMTVVSAFRKVTLLAALVVLGWSPAWAIDPSLSPRAVEPVVPQPQEPYSNFPLNPNGPFDPFAPGTNPTLPANPARPGSEQLRVVPQVAPQPEQPAEPSRWRLGIFSTNTGTGVQIVRKTSGSPADAAGLEEDDVIVTVSGYQVGYVSSQVRDLGQAFNEHADTDGHVELLVHDHRTGNLVTLPVNLDSRFERIQGTIGFQAGSRLPNGATAHVALHEIIRQNRQDIVIPLVTKTVTDLRQSPIPFTLEVDPSLITQGRQYVVHADITAGNRTLYTTRNPYRVLTDGYPRTVDMRLYQTAPQGGGQYNGYADNREEQLDQIAQWFREYLNRDPRFNERAVWQSHIDRGGSLQEVQADLLAGNEFYTQSDRDDRRYIENMYLAVLGRRPQKAEVDAWIRQLERRGGLRREIAREFLAQVSKQR